MATQMKLPIRGYSFSDNDWREFTLRRLNVLGETEAKLLSRLESEEPMADYEYDRVNRELDHTEAETKRILENFVAPVLYRWWVTDRGIPFI